MNENTNAPEQNQPKKKKMLHDGLLILALLLSALAVWRFFGVKPEDGAVAHVQIEGQEDAYYPLSKTGVYPLNGGTNTLVIEDGWAWMSDADCPDKLCIHQGRIRKNGQWIICLPNRVAVTIEGAEEDAEWDEILGGAYEIPGETSEIPGEASELP